MKAGLINTCFAVWQRATQCNAIQRKPALSTTFKIDMKVVETVVSWFFEQTLQTVLSHEFDAVASMTFICDKKESLWANRLNNVLKTSLKVLDSTRQQCRSSSPPTHSLIQVTCRPKTYCFRAHCFMKVSMVRAHSPHNSSHFHKRLLCIYLSSHFTTHDFYNKNHVLNNLVRFIQMLSCVVFTIF